MELWNRPTKTTLILDLGKAVNSRIFQCPVPDLYYPVFIRYPNFLFYLKKFKKIYHKKQCIVIIYIIACFVCNHAFFTVSYPMECIEMCRRRC